MSRHILRHLCREADDKVTDGDLDSLRVARLCCRLAGRLATDEARAWSFGRLASALRLRDRLGHAKRALEIALAAAPPDLQGDLIRRRAIIRIYEDRYPQAVRDAERALELTAGVEHARALEALGVALYYRGEDRAAIRTLAQCLQETEPDDSRYCNAIQNYATALSRGTDADVARAIELCAEVRPRLRFRHKMQRAKLWWTEGLLHRRLGDERTAWRSLDTARRSLAAMQAGVEVAAVVADMAQLSAEPIAVRLLCDEAAEVIAAPHPLTRPLKTLAAAARELIPEAAAALRAAAGRLATCPAL